MPYPCRILQKYTTFGESNTHPLTFLKSPSNIDFCPWIASNGRSPPGWEQTLSALERHEESSSPLPNYAPSSLIKHHDKGTQFAQGRYQNRRVIRRFTEDFDFDAMNEKFNKKEVWELFSKNNKARADDGGEATEVHDNSKPVYCKDDLFDYLSYGAPDLETLTEQRRRDDETFGIEIPILHHGKGPHSAGRSFGGRGHGNVRGSHRGPGRRVWRPVLK